MDAFEHIVARIFENRGYWVKIGYKVELSAAEKRKLGNPNMPRPEIDVLAYKPGSQELLLIECKGYMSGVLYESLNNPKSKYASKYKLFHNAPLRKMLRGNLAKQLTAQGLLPQSGCVSQLCLAAARISPADELKLEKLFKKKQWRLFTPANIVYGLEQLRKTKRENDVVTMVTKLLDCNPKHQ